MACERVSVFESLRQNWIDSVGADTLPLMETLLELRRVQPWNKPDLERFVEEHRRRVGLGLPNL